MLNIDTSWTLTATALLEIALEVRYTVLMRVDLMIHCQCNFT